MIAGEVMLYDFINLNKKSSNPLYRQLHDQLRSAILSNLLAPGQRLLSIRLAAGELDISRMTVETAYQQLCLEGFLESRPQKGYFVADNIRRPANSKQHPDNHETSYRYDFRSGRIDATHNDLRLWQKHMRAVLTREEVLTSYGDPQGEPALREALAAYCFEARGVRANPEQIVIGAGTQPLLTLLCGLLADHKPLVAGIETPGFPQAEQVLGDFGIEVVPLNRIDQKIYDQINLYIYLSANAEQEGFQHEMQQRNRLVSWRLAEPARYILEDDYNGELRFLGRPIPALQGMDEGIVFLGSFSRLLLPSVRIAYMVLPEELAAKFRQKAGAYNQTAGKVEQLALAEYIRQGQLEKRLRRLRKLYQKKSQAVALAVERYFKDIAEFELRETQLRYLITLNSDCSCSELVHQAEGKGIGLMPYANHIDGRPQLIMSIAGIPLEDIAVGMQVIAECWRDM